MVCPPLDGSIGVEVSQPADPVARQESQQSTAALAIARWCINIASRPVTAARIVAMARTAGPELACSFCGKQQPAVKLIAGPRTIICSECVARCLEVVPEVAHSGEARADLTCSFCGMSDPTLVQPPSELGTEALVCRRCLTLCQDVVAERL
jgi:ClpX C4-type zinc finger